MDTKQIQYTIGELGRRMRVPVTTLRYYERAGLLQPDKRSVAGYRLYGDRAISRLIAINRARNMGFSGREIEELLHLDAGKGNCCAAACRICQTKIIELRHRIAVLRTALRELECVSKACTYNESGRRCAILGGIFDQATARGRGRSEAA